jgi:hypothetical protein
MLRCLKFSSTLIGGKGGARPNSSFTLRLRVQRRMWMRDGCRVYVDSYMASSGSCFMVTWTVFKNHLLEVGLIQNQETMAFRTLTTVGLFMFYHALLHGTDFINHAKHMCRGLRTWLKKPTPKELHSERKKEEFNCGLEWLRDTSPFVIDLNSYHVISRPVYKAKLWLLPMWSNFSRKTPSYNSCIILYFLPPILHMIVFLCHIYLSNYVISMFDFFEPWNSISLNNILLWFINECFQSNAYECMIF